MRYLGPGGAGRAGSTIRRRRFSRAGIERGVTDNMKGILTVLALGLLVCVPVSLAQGVMQLSLKRAVDIALTPEGSARVALAEESIRSSETQVSQARAGFLPTVDGSVEERSQTINL